MQIETRQILILLIIFGFLSRDFSALQIERFNGKLVWRARPIFAFLVFLPIFLMVVFGRVRSDTGLYLRLFHAVPTSFNNAVRFIVTSAEPGFSLLNVAIKSVFGKNDTAFRFIIALIHSLPLILILRRYSDDYVYSVFLFVALNNHVAWMMNGLRQFIAVTIIFAATPCFLRRDTVKSIICILFASLFHRTALFMIPVIFIVRGKVWNWKTVLFSVMVVVATFFFAQYIGVFERLADTFGYSLRFAQEIGDDGTNPLRVLIHAIPMALAFVFREGLRKDQDPVVNLCVNMSVITTGIYLISMVTSGIMVGRMPIYTSIYNLILFPYILHHCLSEKTKPIVFLGSIVFYTLFLFLDAGGI